MCEKLWIQDWVVSQHLVSAVLTGMHGKHGSQGLYDIVDSIVDGIGLPDLGIS